MIEFDEELDHFFFSKKLPKEKNTQLDDESAYLGLSKEALLTSYVDYFQVLNDLPEGERLIDLGAGYCRGSLLSEFLTLNDCLSIEYIPQRAHLAQKALSRFSDRKLIKCLDLKEVELPKAYAYYLYFPKGEILDKILINIFKHSPQVVSYFYVCESHGDLIDYLDSFLNLNIVKKFNCSLPRHSETLVKFEVQPISTPVLRETNFSLWWILHKDNPNYISIDFFHMLLKRKVEWIVRFKDLELIIYNQKVAFHHSSGRIILINDGEPIKRIGYHHEKAVKSIFTEKTKKIFYDHGYFYEDSNGVLHTVKDTF